MTGLARIEEFDLARGTITVEAGVSVGTILRLIVRSGWCLPVIPGTRHVTVGGAIANDVHGKNHLRAGSFCRHVRSFDLLTPARGIVVVDRESEPGLFAATSGGLGLTGFILRATLQLARVETGWMLARSETAGDLDALMNAMADDADFDHAVAWIDGHARGSSFGRAVLSRARHATAAELPRRNRAALAGPSEPPAIAMGGPATGHVLRQALPVINEARFRWAARHHRQSRFLPIASFAFPLDRFPRWNRLFGRAGLVQYQFVVPFGGDHIIETVLQQLRCDGPPPTLISLKRLGGSGAMLSFPIAGWCLAVDLAAGHPTLARTLDRCDEIMAGAGGRVYLAKDSRVRRDAFETMYPELDSWRSMTDAVDPEHRIASDMARRLGLKACG